ncbi:hypothetical protein LCGC14_2030300, partial [marine sediment metagenome]
MALSDLLLKKVDRSQVRKGSNVHGYFARRGVSKSGEFARINNLPRRDWQDKNVEHMTKLLRTTGGEMTLWPQQAAALYELACYRGLFAPLNVGDGKALISLLAAVVLEAKRPILFVPPDLREQTRRRVIPEMRKHWKLHPRLRVIGSNELSLAKNATLLDKFEPDVIILDEAHQWKSLQAARTKRLLRYERENPATIIIGLSGTMASKSLRDYAHIARWCLKDTLCPVPTKWQELQDWADAIDERIPNEMMRMGPGALEQWVTDEDRETKLDRNNQPVMFTTARSVRRAYGRRLAQTPGVIMTSGEDRVGSSLIVRAASPGHVPPKVRTMMGKLRDTWETPNGDVLLEPVDVWRHMREMALGFFYKWDPPAPRDWLDARREWKVHVRETLKHNR